MANGVDVTQARNHLFWLWSAYVALFIAGLTAFLQVLNREEELYRKIAADEMVVKVQLAEIKATMKSIETSLAEIKENQRRITP